MGIFDFLKDNSVKPAASAHYQGTEKLYFAKDYTILCLSVSGENPETGRITELYCEECRNGTPCSSYKSTFDANEETDFEKFFSKLQFYISDNTLMGPNIKRDIQFLAYAYYRATGEPLKYDYIDFSKLAQKTYPRLSKYGLYDVAKHCKVKLKDITGLKKDCRTLWYTYQVLIEVARETGVYKKLSPPKK